MVKNIGLKKVKGGEGVVATLPAPSQHPPFVQFWIQDGRSDLKNFFMDRSSS